MSPTENDLRAALRDGEGDEPDVARIITSGLRARERRTRLINTAAAVVVVAGIVTGGAFALGRGGTSKDSAGSNQADQHSAGSAAAGGGRLSGPAAGAAASPPYAAIRPSPQRAIGGSLDATCAKVSKAGSAPVAAPAGQLFAGPVTRIDACAFGSKTAAKGITLTGSDARAVLASLGRTTRTRPPVMCPDYRMADELTLELTGYDADGNAVGTLVTNLGRPACATTVSNGATIRFGWQPPAALGALMQPVGGVSHGPVAPPTK